MISRATAFSHSPPSGEQFNQPAAVGFTDAGLPPGGSAPLGEAGGTEVHFGPRSPDPRCGASSPPSRGRSVRYSPLVFLRGEMEFAEDRDPRGGGL